METITSLSLMQSARTRSRANTLHADVHQPEVVPPEEYAKTIDVLFKQAVEQCATPHCR